MAIVNAFGWSMITPEFHHKTKYWKILTDHIREKIGSDEIKDSAKVQELLKECFEILSEEFMKLINNQKLASFYLFVHNFHENSLELWSKQLSGVTIPLNEEDFAATRRVLKIIIEQGCGIDLQGSENFSQEIFEKRIEFKEYLEELLYIGYWAIGISDYIARSQLFPRSIGIKIEENELNILSYSPYKYVYKYIFEDIPTHSNSVVVYNTIDQLKDIWEEKLGLKYDVLASIINQQKINFNYRFSVVKLEELINFICEEYNYERKIVEDFYNGLIISKDNKLSFENCILRNQDMNRIIYRPIVKLHIDNDFYYLIGRNKWIESFTILTTNAFPWGKCPDEWKKHDQIRDFINNLESTHDSILEDAIIELIKEKQYIFDRNIKSLKRQRQSNIRIDIPTVGEIDIIFINSNLKNLYICECKHNRSRFDMFNWRRDYSNFKNSYEAKLKRKVDWAKDNKETILEHLEIISDLNIINKQDYSVNGIFIINAPTVYMYDCIFPTLTIQNFTELLNDNYEPPVFVLVDDETKVETVVKLPFFQNFDNIMLNRQ